MTLLEVVIVLAAIALMAGILHLTLTQGRESSYKVQCCSNLKNVYTMAMTYSDNSETGAFPIGAGKRPKAHESLNVMLEFMSDPDLDPRLFNCPSGEAVEAQRDDAGLFQLDETTLAFAWTARRLSNRLNRVLASDKYVQDFEDDEGRHSGHPDGVILLMSSGSVAPMRTEDLHPDTKLPPGLTR